MCCCCVHQIRHDTHTHKFIVCNFSRKKSQNYWLWSFGHNAAKLKMFECSLRLLWAKMFRLCWIIRWNSEIKCENTLRWCIENPWWCYEHWAYPPTCYMVIWPTDNLLAYPFLVNVKVGTSFGYSFFFCFLRSVSNTLAFWLQSNWSIEMFTIWFVDNGTVGVSVV